MRDAAVESVAVGFFDGVHLGHQAILRGATAVVTFRNHPLSVLAPERAPRLIMSPDERAAAVRACGVAQVTMLDFTSDLAVLEPSVFAETYLRPFGRVRCGLNWRFGKEGGGDADFLRANGFDVEVVPSVEYGGERISSSRIRLCLARGEIEDANAMMGRRLKVFGERERGKGLGRKLGFPTVNLIPQSSFPLPPGVYEVVLDGLRGLANFGVAPTMGDRAWAKPVLEVHLLDSSAPDFPSPVPVEFVRFLRPERKFSSVGDLRRQIAADCELVSGGGGCR